MAHTRHSRTDYGLDFQTKILETLAVMTQQREGDATSQRPGPHGARASSAEALHRASAERLYTEPV